MKILKSFLFILLLIIGLAGFYFVYGLYINPKSPLEHVDYTDGDTEISIRYYRPYKNERLIFGTKERVGS